MKIGDVRIFLQVKGGGKMENIVRLRNEINRVFVGKEEVCEKVLICLLAQGHVLLEDVPGVGKTTLAYTLANAAGCSFGRISFTPDTLPGDVLGMTIYNMKTGEFTYQQGAIHHQIILGDEINRTSPKTQAALLEAMAEGKVTVDGKTYALPKPFMVIATQNPVEFVGTYPLPEAQLDRFMMKLTIGYPDREQEMQMASKYLHGETSDTVMSVCDAETILSLQEKVRGVSISDAVLGYVEDIIRLTREEERFVLGASPRAMLALLRASQARAFLQGRDYVKPDDVKQMAEAVLLHRLVLSNDARIRKENAGKILQSLVIKAKLPV